MWNFLRKLIDKQTGAAAAMRAPIPDNWKSTAISADACEVKIMVETAEPKMPLSEAAMLDGLAGRSRPDAQRKLSFILAKAEINGSKIRLMSAGIPIDPQTLHMLLLQKEAITVYYNPSDPEEHRFDLHFLS